MKTLAYFIVVFCFLFLSLHLSAQTDHLTLGIYTYGYYGKSKMVKVYALSPYPKGRLYKKIYPDVNGGYIFSPKRILSNGWANVIVDNVNCWTKNLMVYAYLGDSLVINLYSEPSSRSCLVYKLEDNTPLIVVGFKDEWINVKFNHKKRLYKGWIYKNNTDPSGV